LLSDILQIGGVIESDPKHWQQGMPVVVQVTRLGSGHKGPRVTARPTLPGRNVVLCPDGKA
jgi:Ribonuclease G/E